jgi:DNA-binding CsgD family transcriptional regulator
LYELLTEKQAEVLRLIEYGYKDIEIAKIMGISAPTVNQHKQAIRAKLQNLSK